MGLTKGHGNGEAPKPRVKNGGAPGWFPPKWALNGGNFCPKLRGRHQPFKLPFLSALIINALTS